MNIKNKLKNSLLPYIILLLIIFSLFFYFALSNFNMAQRKEDYIANLNFMFTAAENSQTPVYLLYKDKKIELTPLEIKRIKFYISQVKDIVNKRNMKEEPTAFLAIDKDKIELYKLNEEDAIVVLENESGQYGIKSSANNTWLFLDSLAKKN